MITTKKRKFDLITVGGATVDISFYSKEGEIIKTGNATKQRLLAFEYGAKIVADRVFTTCGGGSANAAVSASRLGLKTAFVGRIGGDEHGRMVLKNFKANGVATDLIKIDSKEQTAFSTILTLDNPAKEHIAFVYRGANAKFSAGDIPSVLPSDWLFVTSLPLASWEDIMLKLTKMKKKITWNPGNEQLRDIAKIKKYLPQVEVFVVNRDEAMEFKKLKDIRGLLLHIFELGPKLVVITDGAEGAYAYDGKKYYYMKARSRKTINTLGVGDAFGSALTSALVCDKTIPEALSWGIKNSASVVSQIGAQAGLLNRKDIEK